MEEIIFYTLIFVIGTLFGSFFTLAIYRIPLHQDITHKRSYCPTCNHKLSFLDMVPILSYLLLKGKCRYCKQKIRIRYLLLEVLTGILFLLFAMSININFNTLEIDSLIYLIFGFLYIAGLVILAGIDKERHEISKPVILYEIVIMSIYMIYLYIVEKTNVYRYVIYFLFIILFLFIENIHLKHKLKDYYPFGILQLSIIMAIFSSEIGFILTVIFTLFMIIIERLIKVITKNTIVKKEKSYYDNLPIGFYLCTANIIILVVTNWLACRG